MWVTTHELLQFIGIQNFDGNCRSSKNNEDNFFDITDIFIKMTRYESNKIPNIIQSEKILFKVLVTI